MWTESCTCWSSSTQVTLDCQSQLCIKVHVTKWTCSFTQSTPNTLGCYQFYGSGLFVSNQCLGRTYLRASGLYALQTCDLNVSVVVDIMNPDAASWHQSRIGVYEGTRQLASSASSAVGRNNDKSSCFTDRLPFTRQQRQSAYWQRPACIVRKCHNNPPAIPFRLRQSPGVFS